MKRIARRVLVQAVVVAMATTAAAAETDLHAGLNARSDLGTNQVRVQVGARWRALEATVVLDPHSFSSRQSDQDVAVAWWFAPRRFGAFAGWRTSRVELFGMASWHQKALTGLVGQLAEVASGRVRFVAGAEVCVDVVRHGAGEQTEWVDASSRRAFDDLLNASLFARAEVALGW